MPETAAESALILPNRSQRPVEAERPVLVWLPSARPFLWLAMLGFWHWGMASCRLTHVGEIAERCICRRHEHRNAANVKSGGCSAVSSCSA